MISRNLLWTILAPLLATHGIRAATVTDTFNGITMFQEYSVAPNVNSLLTGWNSYVENMKAAASSSGFGSAGDPSTPGYFQVANGIIPLSNVVTARTGASTPTNRRFPMWHGQANPGSVFGPAFANEYGNYLHSPLLIVSNGGPFTLTTIERKIYSELYKPGGDPWQSLSDINSFSSARIGVTSFGGDGELGGGDDTYITSGLFVPTNPNPPIELLAFIMTGPGNAVDISAPYDPTPENLLDNQPWPNTMADEDIFPAYFEQWQDDLGDTPWDYRVDYKVNYQVGSNPFNLSSDPSFSINVVPEPSVWALSVAACLALLRRRRPA